MVLDILTNPAIASRLVFVFGITNLTGLALVFFSCRCMTGPRIGNWLMARGWFRRFYRYHCWFWWFFFASVLLHTVYALWLYR